MRSTKKSAYDLTNEEARYFFYSEIQHMNLCNLITLANPQVYRTKPSILSCKDTSLQPAIAG
jgi:hypothetical protein